MRKQILTVAAAGALALTGVAAAGPALAAVGADSAAAVVTSRVDRITEALSGLVTDGTLTQAEADEVAETLGSSDALRGPGGGFGGPGRGGHGPDLATAATALGTTEAELRTALEGGATLAEVAEDEGVAVDTLVSALVEAERTRLAEAVADGRLTQAQADERLAVLTERVTERVDSARPLRGPGGHGHGPGSTDDTDDTDGTDGDDPAEAPEAPATTAPSAGTAS